MNKSKPRIDASPKCGCLVCPEHEEPEMERAGDSQGEACSLLADGKRFDTAGHPPIQLS